MVGSSVSVSGSLKPRSTLPPDGFLLLLLSVKLLHTPDIHPQKLVRKATLTGAAVVLQHCMDTNERDSDGLTPLMHAVAGGHEEVVSPLLAHGARLGVMDSQRRSVLHWAVLTFREAVLRLLLKHVATDDPLLIDACDETGRTPLHAVIDAGFEIGVSILMECGVNIHSRARKP